MPEKKTDTERKLDAQFVKVARAEYKVKQAQDRLRVEQDRLNELMDKNSKELLTRDKIGWTSNQIYGM